MITVTCAVLWPDEKKPKLTGIKLSPGKNYFIDVGTSVGRAEWVFKRLFSTKSMITNYSSYDLVDFAIKAVEIFEEIDSKIYPSRLKMVQMAIDHMQSAQIYQRNFSIGRSRLT